MQEFHALCSTRHGTAVERRRRVENVGWSINSFSLARFRPGLFFLFLASPCPVERRGEYQASRLADDRCEAIINYPGVWISTQIWRLLKFREVERGSQKNSAENL